MQENKSKYCYDNGVLINKRDIREFAALESFSRDVTTFRISQLVYNQNVIYNFFDVKNYLNLHKFLFSDIYFFAGEVRDEVIYKSNAPYANSTTIFAMPNVIVTQLKEILSKMSFRVQRIKCRDDLLEYLAYFYGEINIVHPFREGNGRTLRTYMKLLVEYLNKYFPDDMIKMELDYSKWTPDDREELLKATIICNITADCSYIKKCFDKVLVKKELTKIKGR